jgi:hypothetical protein
MGASPPCFWPACDAGWRLDADLVHLIDEELTRPLPDGISKIHRHNMLQRRLAELGSRLGYGSAIEVATGYRRFVQTGRFDVAWTRPDGQPPIIFEIDSCWRRESLVKLGRVGKEAQKLWIYYGQRPWPPEPTEPGFRRLNMLRIGPSRRGVNDGRRRPVISPGRWPEALFPPGGEPSLRLA